MLPSTLTSLQCFLSGGIPHLRRPALRSGTVCPSFNGFCAVLEAEYQGVALCYSDIRYFVVESFCIKIICAHDLGGYRYQCFLWYLLGSAGCLAECIVGGTYEIAPDTNTTDNFVDAGNTYYTGYLAAAKRLGISTGVGDNRFTPEQVITRQEMFTLQYNALKVLEKLPEGDCGKTLSDFTDSGSIAAYAQEAMTSLVKSGTISGSDGKLDPNVGSTRAQMAQVLYNLLKN